MHICNSITIKLKKYKNCEIIQNIESLVSERALLAKELEMINREIDNINITLNNVEYDEEIFEEYQKTTQGKNTGKIELFDNLLNVISGEFNESKYSKEPIKILVRIINNLINSNREEVVLSENNREKAIEILVGVLVENREKLQQNIDTIQDTITKLYTNI